jgi:hypothetical protein
MRCWRFGDERACFGPRLVKTIQVAGFNVTSARGGDMLGIKLKV